MHLGEGLLEGAKELLRDPGAREEELAALEDGKESGILVAVDVGAAEVDYVEAFIFDRLVGGFENTWRGDHFGGGRSSGDVGSCRVSSM